MLFYKTNFSINISEIIKKVLLCLFFVLVFLQIQSPVFADTSIYETFDTAFSNPETWIASANNGDISFNSNPGYITLSSSSTSFPYVESKNTFNLTGNFEITIRFQYLVSALNYGAGIAVSQDDKNVFGIWQDSGENKYLRISTNVCPLNNPNCSEAISFYITESPDFNSHTVKYKYNNGGYFVYFDGELIFTSTQTNLIPNRIWFGNNKIMGSSAEWANFMIDYISVFEDIKPKLILLPGMTSCWNSITVSDFNSGWHLWPYALNATYKPLIRNLENAGLDKNTDFYVFCYDWRQPINDSKNDLSAFIQNNTLASEKVDLVGHSMGGLVARAYTQENPFRVSNLITAGSPHEGAAEAYFAWAGGELFDKEDWKLHAKEIALEKMRPLNPHKNIAIQEKIPSIKDLLPTYPFLVNADNLTEIKGITNKEYANNFLINLNNTLYADVKNLTTTIYGNTGPYTLDQIIISDFNEITAFYIHQNNKEWSNGWPIYKENTNYDYSPSFIMNSGDNTVTAHSATIDGVNSFLVNADHRSTISDTSAVAKIFEVLNINSPIESVSTVDLETIVSFILHSPADLTVMDEQTNQSIGHLGIGETIPNSFYDEAGKIVTIGNPPKNLKLKITGSGEALPNSRYSVSVISTENADSFSHEFKDNINPGETKSFYIDLDQNQPFFTPPNFWPIHNSMLQKLIDIRLQIENSNLVPTNQKSKTVNDLDQAIKKTYEFQTDYNAQQYHKAIIDLSYVLNKLFAVRKFVYKNVSDSDFVNIISAQTHNVLPEWQYLFLDTYQQSNMGFSDKYLHAKLKVTEKMIENKFKVLQNKYENDQEVYPYQSLAYNLAKENLQTVKVYLNQEKNPEAFVYLQYAFRFGKEI